MIKELIYYFLITVIILGCDTKKKNLQNGKDQNKKTDTTDGVKKYYTSDGKLKNEITILQGKRNGVARTYYKNGKVSLEMNYKTGKRDGSSKRYYENGTLYQETNYNDDKIDGIRKKYRENGRPMSVARYESDFPCNGLKEYLLSGEPKDNFPSMVITTQDNLLTKGIYSINLSLSDKSKRVKFYIGNLSTSGCLTYDLIGTILDKKTGIGTVQYSLSPGGFMMEELNFIAEVETNLGNTYLAQKKFYVSIENK